MPSSAGEHSPQTFTLVGGGGQGETPNFLENWWQDEDKGCPRAQAPSSAVLERDHLTVALVVQRHFWNALPAPILASPNFTSSLLLQMFLLLGRYPGCCCSYRAVGWGCCSGDVVRALSREDGRSGGLQVQGELSEEGIREELKCWKGEPGSLNSSSGWSQ